MESEDSQQRTFWANDYERNSQFNYPDNYISTTKYTWFNFLPLSLLLQFTRIANIYFLVTAVLQSIPEISPLHPFSAIAPLVFVLAVAMTRDGVEDYFRHKSDLETNSSETKVYRDGAFTTTTFKDIFVGEVVMIEADECFPCDLILLNSSNENGMTYIETANLDGEKNVKPKQPASFSVGLFTPDWPIRILSKVSCELPNPKFDIYNGSIEVDGEAVSLDKKQLLLSGAFLRNTKWAIGVACFTGNDTKIRMNAEKGGYKVSRVERTVNKYILAIMLVQFFLCATAAIGASIWYEANLDDHVYLPEDKGEHAFYGFLTYFTSFLLLNTLIPISLVVSLELIKVAQAIFMSKDLRMYSATRDRPCKVSSSSLNEELGMIKHIFTDKTGTLTSNKMEFRYASVGEDDYGKINDSQIFRRPSYSDRNIAFTFDISKISAQLFGDDQKISYDIKINCGIGSDCLTIKNQQQLLNQFLTCLALCHECVIDKSGEDIAYNGQSPDEITLVHLASAIGYRLIDRSQNKATIAVGQFSPEEKEFDILNLMEFSSDRKRNSVIVRDRSTNQIILYCKGADDEIKARLSKDGELFKQRLTDELQQYSREGMRTLCVACRLLSEAEYNEWNTEYTKANNEVVDRVEKVEKLSNQIEQQLFFLGVTAVEDRLQDYVPRTISAFHQANIDIWMLTGDKMETAENIAKTAGLINSDMTVKQCKASNVEECAAQLTDIDNAFSAIQLGKALVIDGNSLQYILFSPDNPDHCKAHPELLSEKALSGVEQCRQTFVRLSSTCETVVCCRVTPGQKRDVVKTMKDQFGTVTMAVGDGANDVSMILEAHIGVGIYGEEGMQAVQASDFAVGEFQYLYRLLIIHGRWNYIRISMMIQYFFYKNLVFTIPQFFFMFSSGFSGQTLYDDWYITFYNVVFTGLSVLVWAIYERDINLYEHTDELDEETDKRTTDILDNYYPHAYLTGQKNKIFTRTNFVIWWLTGIIHAAIAYCLPLLAFQSNILNSDGYSSDMWSWSITSFTCVIFMVTIKLVFYIQLWNILIFLCVTLLSLIAYVCFMFAYDAFQITVAYQTMQMVASCSYFYLCVILWVAFVLVFDEFIHTIKINFFPSYSEIVQDYACGRKKITQARESLEPMMNPSQVARFINVANVKQ